MKQTVSLVAIACAGGLAVSAVIADGPPPLKVDKTKPLLLDSPPPLKVDKNAPLLLDEPKKQEKHLKVKGPVADNSACFVCHTNYQEEEMALVHANANVGCVKCHGQSIQHRNDENNITPPDIMIAADGIEAACTACHETHDAPAKKVVARWQQKCPAKENPDDLVCTDCHGEHRLKFRSVWWDKKTRKLIVDAKNRIKMNPDYTKKPGEKKEEKGK